MSNYGQDTGIDHLYFLHWKKSAGTGNFLGMFEELDSSILVHSFHEMCPNSNWRHSKGFEQVATALYVISYTTIARISLYSTQRINQ